MASITRALDNSEYVKDLDLMKRIKTEQRFANQVYAQFKSVRFGIASCCFTDYVSAVISKELCDWQHSASDKVVVATEQKGTFVEPLARINAKSSQSCPTTPSNVCTILDLEALIADAGTYTFCQDAPLVVWNITHNLGKFPSVTVVDSGNSIVIGDVTYISSNQIQIEFADPFNGCAYLN